MSIFELSTQVRSWDEVSDQTWGYWLSNGSWGEVRLASAADLLADSFAAQDEDPYPFITMIPNPTVYENIHPTLFFESMNTITSPISSIFGVFGTSASVSASAQTLIHIRNKLSNDEFNISLNSASLNYSFNDTILKTFTVSASSTFIAGLDIDEITKDYRAIVENFFAIPQNLTLNLGGYETQTLMEKSIPLHLTIDSLQTKIFQTTSTQMVLRQQVPL